MRYLIPMLVCLSFGCRNKTSDSGLDSGVINGDGAGQDDTGSTGADDSSLPGDAGDDTGAGGETGPGGDSGGGDSGGGGETGCDLTWFQDNDLDGYGDPGSAVTDCEAPEGYVDNDLDCDDDDSEVHPGVKELPYDGVDNDCDAATADDDLDGDGYGSAELGGPDCDDSDPAISPAADEYCDGVDNNCDGEIDEDGAVDADTWYADGDDDGYGTDDDTTTSCVNPEGYAEYGGDCDDTDPAYNPGADEDDCADPNDYNCDGSVGYTDGDGDGYAACEECDDRDAAVNPDAEEVCDDVDNDCDGTVDVGAADAPTWYYDGDRDGFGDMDVPQAACDQPLLYVDNAGDCDDDEAEVNPDAEEICDGIDNNCDEVIDDDAVDQSTWYADGDLDGWGDDASTTEACDEPFGYAAEAGDCDDDDGDVNPGADEECDEIDNDCDAATDEGFDEDGDGFKTCEGDCDDSPLTGAAVNPDAEEVCDDVDNNCDGEVDEDSAVDASTWYADGDVDGYGDPDDATAACDRPLGYTDNDLDCDDGDGDINPGGEEVCDGVDNDCDGTVDVGAADADTFYADDDGDGWGDPDDTTAACDAPDDTVDNSGDCDDANNTINPDADEECDGVDNNCDGEIDEDGAVDATTWYADGDVDGWGDEGEAVESCELPFGYAAEAGDCDDDDGDVNPGADEECDEIDNDCDAATDEGFDEDGDGFLSCDGDCDDDDAAVNPDADELCDGIDNNCDGLFDGADAVDRGTFYADDDDDGYGDPDAAVLACDAPDGTVEDDGDCDDTSAATFPGADETCDEADNDCDAVIDEDAIGDATWYADDDGDGYGVSGDTVEACERPDGYANNDRDCDDDDGAVNPAADETCDEIDNDCDDDVDEDGAVDAATWYFDYDNDSFGSDSLTTTACDQPLLYTDEGGDCDDTRASDNPDASETCDDRDNDCDGSVDEEAGDVATFYADDDGDGFGDEADARAACLAPEGYIEDGGDCDDGDGDINPDAEEVCDDVDNDCDGTADVGAADADTWYADDDSDGYGDDSDTTEACDQPGGTAAVGGDCDDAIAAVNPGADEYCNGTDDDCDSDVDEDGAVDAATWYLDIDGDDFGSDALTQVACDEPASYAAVDGDCDDYEAATWPGADEVCDEEDNDCDAAVDEDAEQIWYLDYDGDGYGDDDRTFEGCEAPTSDYVEDGGDCDDEDEDFNPGEPEGCDDLDHDCDGAIDNDGDGDGYSSAECGGSDCDDTDPEVLPEVDGGCALGMTCLDILEGGYAEGDGVYIIDPDGYGVGLDPFEVSCDMTTDGGGWTAIEYAEDLDFIQHYTDGDGWRYFANDFELVLTDEQVEAIQDLSTDGYQVYEGWCEHVIHYYYDDGGNYDYAFGFRFFDGTETPYGTSSYSPYDVTVLADGCSGNGGEGGDPDYATIFEFNSVLVPVVNVNGRDVGDAFPEYFGSPLTDHPAWLR